MRSNMIVTIGAFVLAVGVLISLINFAHVSLRSGRAGRPRSVAAPTARMVDGFAAAGVRLSAHPHGRDAAIRSGTSTMKKAIRRRRRVLDQGRLTARHEPARRAAVALAKMPEDTIMPLLLALALTCRLHRRAAQVGGVAESLGDRWSAALAGAWLWPEKEKQYGMSAIVATR